MLAYFYLVFPCLDDIKKHFNAIDMPNLSKWMND